MKTRKTIYCDYQFLKTLPQDQLNDFYKFSNESIIFFNMTLNQFLQESIDNSFFKYLRKRQDGGGCELKFDLNFDTFNSNCENDIINSFNPVVLIYQTNKQRRTENRCGQYYRDFGFLAADQNDFLEKCSITKDYGFAIKKRTENSWKKLLENAPIYGNSLIIVDNYLLSDRDIIDCNLKPLLNILLPESLITEFNITFVTQDSNLTLQLRPVMINKIIEDIRPDLNCSVNFFVDKDKCFHDRVIISNYYWIQCGAGFDLFGIRSKARHSTTLSFIYPFIQNYNPWAVDAFCNLLEDVKELAGAAVNNGSVKQYYGLNKNNRLFEMQ